MGEGVETYLDGQLDELATSVAALREDPSLLADLSALLDAVVSCLQSGGTIHFAGNGGSAADADHLAAEFVGRCTRERRGLPAMALTASSATLTALANDYGYENVFRRQVEAQVRPGDVVILLSTSGRSPNVVAAAPIARAQGARVAALVGAGPSDLASAADLVVRAPSSSTQRIQELHKFFGHCLAGWVDEVWQ